MYNSRCGVKSICGTLHHHHFQLSSRGIIPRSLLTELTSTSATSEGSFYYPILAVEILERQYRKVPTYQLALGPIWLFRVFTRK
jgi:hypothetical protein